MSLPRLRDRVPSAERIGAFTLKEHSLRFHKVSTKDGSAKCDALFTGKQDDAVIGALFEIAESEKDFLDSAEGLGFGYQEKIVSVHDAQGNTLTAVTYYATTIDPSLFPYSWYLYHVIYGAKETGVPANYLDTIETITSIEDPDSKRDERERSLYN